MHHVWMDVINTWNTHGMCTGEYANRILAFFILQLHHLPRSPPQAQPPVRQAPPPVSQQAPVTVTRTRRGLLRM